MVAKDIIRCCIRQYSNNKKNQRRQQVNETQKNEMNWSLFDTKNLSNYIKSFIIGGFPNMGIDGVVDLFMTNNLFSLCIRDWWCVYMSV